LESRATLSPTPPRGPRRRLPARAPAGRHASVQKARWTSDPRSPAGAEPSYRPLGGHSSAERGEWPQLACTHRNAGLAGRAARYTLRDRRAPSQGEMDHVAKTELTEVGVSRPAAY